MQRSCSIISIGSSSKHSSFDYHMDEEEDEDEYDDDIALLPTTRSLSLSPSKTNSPVSSRGRTSIRKTPLQRLLGYALDILEADDFLPDDETIGRVYASGKSFPRPADSFFTPQNGQAILRIEVLAKLVSLVRSCTAARAKDDLRSGARTSTGSTAPEPDSIDSDELGRLLRLIHRSMSEGQGVDPFEAVSKKRAGGTWKATKAKRSRTASSSPTKQPSASSDRHGDDDVDVDESQPLSGLRLVVQRLGILAYSGLAAHCSLSLLSSQHTSEAVRCEEMILPSIQILRTIVRNVLLPLLQSCAGTASGTSIPLNELIETVGASVQASRKGKGKGATLTQMSAEADECRHLLGKLFDSLQHLLSQVYNLATLPGWVPSDASVSILASIILPTLFAAEPDPQSSTADVKAGKATWSLLAESRGKQSSLLAMIRLPALQAIQEVYKRCEREQQLFIINTILDNVGDMPEANKQARRHFGLANGKSIHSVSALMIHLVQGSARQIEVTEGTADVVPSASQETVSSSHELAQPDSTAETVEVLRQQLDEPRGVAKQIAEGLMTKVKAIRTSKASGEHGMGSMLDCIANDLLETLFLPSWPGSSLLVSYLTRLFVACLEDRQATPDLRGVAIDFLGLVAARLHESQARMRSLSSNRTDRQDSVGRLNIVVESQDSRPVAILERAYGKLVQNLQGRDKFDINTHTGAARYLSAQWAVELACVHRRVSERLEAVQAAANGPDYTEAAQLSNKLAALDDAVKAVTTEPACPVVAGHAKQAIADEEQPESVQELFEAILHTFNYMVPCELIQAKLIESSGGPVAINRGKALRALGTISQADELYMQQIDVRTVIQRCLLDESVNVREGAVALLGRFVLANASYIEPLFHSLKTKVDDAGLLVRKRALRLVGEIYHKTASGAIRAEAASEIVRCIHDEEQSMQDLATHVAVSIWFTPAAVAHSQAVVAEDSKLAERMAQEENAQFQAQIASLTAVAERANARLSPLEQTIRRLLDSDQFRESVRNQLNNYVEELASRIALASSESVTPDAIRLAKTLALLTHIQPSSLSVSLAKGLLPCVHSCTTQDDLTMLGYLLEVFSSCLPTMSKMASSFAQKLQNHLRPLISQPSPHLPVLPELVRCYSTVIRHHTKDHAILVKTLQQCHRLLCAIVSKARSRKAALVADRNDAVVIRLTALLVEASDFDRIRAEVADVASSIDLVTRRPIKDEIVVLLMRLFDNASFVPHALYGLRFMFRAFPDLLLLERVQESLLSILSSHDSTQEKAIVLRSLADALTEEETKQWSSHSACGFGELVGNTESLANPVSFDVMRTYLNPVLQLIAEPSLQSTVLEILQHIIMRGMSHPMECLPTLVALETLIDAPSISVKAQSLHRHLIAKTGSNISFRYAVCARSAWKLHAAQRGKAARGAFAGRSVMQMWYDTVVDNQAKQARLDMLKSLIKSFDVQTTTGECSEKEVDYARFVAESLSVLDFKTVDEVHFAINEIQAILDVAGEHIRVFAMEEVEVEGEDEQEEDDLERCEVDRVVAVGRMALILTFAFLLRHHLMEQFGVSETRNASKASSRMATRKMPASVIAWEDLTEGKRGAQSAYQLAKRELSRFEDLMSS